MRQGLIRVTVIVVVALLLALFFIFLLSGRVKATHGYAFVTSASSLNVTSAIASPTPTTSSQSSSGINPAIVAALITLIGTLVAALIAAGVAIYQTRRNVQNTGSKKTLRRTKRRVQAYRDLLRADPRITSLQVLDMSRPMPVTSVYVRLRLHREARPGYEIDPELLAAEARRDPNALLQAGRRRLESQASTALDPDKAIRTYKRCIIVGDPGAGKTTLLKYLALKSAGKHLAGLPDLPIHIELNDFASSGYNDLLDFASSEWNKRYGIPEEEAHKYMEENLEAGKALLLLDALDETVIGATADMAEDSYRLTRDAIIETATRYHQSPIVVTARKAGYQQRAPLPGFTELEVLDFRPEDIWQFVYNWFAYHPEPQKQNYDVDLITRLDNNPRIQSLAANPLLLSLIVIVYEAQLDLPDRRAELYKQCVEVLLTKWDASRDIRRRREFKPEYKQQLLQETAWYFHAQGRRYFPENELLRVIAEFLPAVDLPVEQNQRVLEEITAENGLLKEQARGWYGFLHLSLQEYFAAQYVVDQNKLDTLLAHRGDPWWEEVMLLYAGQTPDASPLLQKLLGLSSRGEAPLQEDIFYTNLILAGQCLATRPTVRQASLRKAVISRMFDTLTKTPYLLTRQQVAETLIEIGGTELNAHMLGLISNQQIDLKVLKCVVEALGRSDEHSLASALLPLLFNEQIDPDIRESIAVVLGKLGEHSLVSTLLPLLSNQQIDPAVRVGIADALGELGENSVVPDLLPLLSNDQIDWKVRTRIANTLGKLEEPRVIPVLLQLLLDQKINLFVQWGIAGAVGELGGHSTVPQLLSLLSNSQVDPFVRAGVAAALGDLDEDLVVPELVSLLSNPETDPLVGLFIADALGDLDNRSIAPQLVSLLPNSQIDPLVREGITSALGDLDERSVIPQLMSLLSDPQIDSLTHIFIADALGVLGERSIAPQLVSLLSNPQVDLLLYTSFLKVVGNLSERSGGTEILHIFSELQKDCAVRVNIAETLGRLGERSIVPDLLQLLSNPQLDAKVLQSIAETLGKLGESSIVPDLLQLLSNSKLSQDVRKSIAEALGQLADDVSTVHVLMTHLQESDIADDIHRTLWTVSRRAGIWVFMPDGPKGKQIEIVKWGNEPESNNKVTKE